MADASLASNLIKLKLQQDEKENQRIDRLKGRVLPKKRDSYNEQRIPMVSVVRKRHENMMKFAKSKDESHFLNCAPNQPAFGNPQIKAKPIEIDDNLYTVFLNAKSWMPYTQYNFDSVEQRRTVLDVLHDRNILFFDRPIHEMQRLGLVYLRYFDADASIDGNFYVCEDDAKQSNAIIILVERNASHDLLPVLYETTLSRLAYKFTSFTNLNVSMVNHTPHLEALRKNSQPGDILYKSYLNVLSAIRLSVLKGDIQFTCTHHNLSLNVYGADGPSLICTDDITINMLRERGYECPMCFYVCVALHALYDAAFMSDNMDVEYVEYMNTAAMLDNYLYILEIGLRLNAQQNNDEAPINHGSCELAYIIKTIIGLLYRTSKITPVHGIDVEVREGKYQVSMNDSDSVRSRLVLNISSQQKEYGDSIHELMKRTANQYMSIFLKMGIFSFSLKAISNSNNNRNITLNILSNSCKIYTENMKLQDFFDPNIEPQVKDKLSIELRVWNMKDGTAVSCINLELMKAYAKALHDKLPDELKNVWTLVDNDNTAYSDIRLLVKRNVKEIDSASVYAGLLNAIKGANSDDGINAIVRSNLHKLKVDSKYEEPYRYLHLRMSCIIRAGIHGISRYQFAEGINDIPVVTFILPTIDFSGKELISVPNYSVGQSTLITGLME